MLVILGTPVIRCDDRYSSMSNVAKLYFMYELYTTVGRYHQKGSGLSPVNLGASKIISFVNLFCNSQTIDTVVFFPFKNASLHVEIQDKVSFFAFFLDNLFEDNFIFK